MLFHRIRAENMNKRMKITTADKISQMCIRDRYQGMPKSIPVVVSDFVFAAIAEEMGTLFAICLILIYISCFIMFINISLQLTRPFYKILAIGLSVSYGFQLFLCIGGVIKLIPHTGVTLPLISYGGSSVLSTIIIFLSLIHI